MIPARLFAQVRFAGLLLLLVLCLVWQNRCQPVRPRAVCSLSGLVPSAAAEGLPGGLVYAPAAHYWLRLPPADTSRRGPLGASLERKALPRCRWSGGYLVYPLPRRPKQAALDSAARHSSP